MAGFKITALPPNGSLYRFRARAPEGSEIVGRIEWVPESAPPAQSAPKAPALKNPCWADGAGSLRHKGTATAMVGAPGLDGKTVRFVVEQRHEGRWSPYATQDAPVKGGHALAHFDVRNPGNGKSDGGDAKKHPPMLRFRATLI